MTETVFFAPCDPTGNRRSGAGTPSVKLATGCGAVGDQALYRKYTTGKHNNKPSLYKICTWNVQGLNKLGKLTIVEQATQKMAVTGLSETHWKHSGHFTSQNDNLIVCSGNEIDSNNGVAFIVHKRIKDTVLGYEAISDRIITIKLQTKPVNLNLIQVYAPTSTSSQEDIDNFYLILSETISKMPSRELLIILGDFNAKVGETKLDNHLRSVVGNYGMGMRNDRGEMLIEFCAEHGLYVSNTHFQHHIRRLYTWKSPDGHTRNQIDYLLVKSRWKTSIRDVKTYPGLDCGSDHNALVAELCLKLRRPPRTNRVPNRWNPASEEKFKNKVCDALTTMKNASNINQMDADRLWMELKQAIDTSITSCNIQRNEQPKKPWISENTWDLIRRRQLTKREGNNVGEDLSQYRELSRQIDRAVRADKDAYIRSICEEIEKHSNSNQPTDLFKKVRTLSRSFQPRYLPIRDENGERLSTKSEVLERWRQYCKQLMASEEGSERVVLPNPEAHEPPIMKSEIEAALQKLKNGKTPGSDNIVAEMLKLSGENGIHILHLICNKIWKEGKWPKEWMESIYVPLHKKGAKDECNNYRTIALINHASKVMLYILQERLKNYLLPQISPEQAGFVPGRGTRDQLMNVRQMIEKLYEFNVPAIFCFLDYSKAFDTVQWNQLWYILREMAVPEHLIYLVNSLYNNSSAQVRLENELSAPFTVGKGVRQGCVLSPLLFNIYGEWIIRKATEEWSGGVSIGGRKISNLRYADDTTLLAADEREMFELLERIENVSRECGLKLNRDKCCLLVVDRRGVLPQPFQLITGMEKKDSLIYLGAQITNKGGSEQEIRRRIGMAKDALGKLTKIWKDHDIRKQTKLKLVQTLIFPIATYASESWTINAVCRRKVEAFEMISYRRMLRIPWTAHRTNVSVLEELNIEPRDRLLPSIQRRMLKFFGHVLRRDGMEKLTIQGMVDGKRTRGRSPVRYIDQIKTITNMSVPEIMDKVEDREAWREITIAST